jgi:hypothetical protein
MMNFLLQNWINHLNYYVDICSDSQHNPLVLIALLLVDCNICRR